MLHNILATALCVVLSTTSIAHARPGMRNAGLSGCPFHTASDEDLRRANAPSASGSNISGKSHAAIASKINTLLSLSDGVELKDCDSWTLEDLNDILSKLHCHRSSELSGRYPDGSGRALRFGSISEYEEAWGAELLQAVQDPSSIPVLRHAKCAEALMLYSHHISEEGKVALTNQESGLELPSLPVFDAGYQQHAAVGALYSESLTCVSGHNETEGHSSDHKWPHWPEEAHYTGMGHGAYPFWLGGGGGGGTGAPIEVWYSESKASEKFYHTACSMTEAGYSSDVPCYHLMTGASPNPTAYLYTATEDFCCISGPTSGGRAELLAVPPSDFMDHMVLNASYGTLDGTFYSGPVKQYLMTLPNSEAVTYFWYITTMDDLPVQQGEGGFGGRGIEIYHEYNTTSFEATTHDASVFAVPDICQSTTKICAFP